MPPSHGPESIERKIDLTNDRVLIHRAETEVLGALDQFGYPKAAKFAIRLAFEEAITNAFKHGHKGLSASAPVRVELAVGPDRVSIAVEDQGPGFSPSDVPDPTLDENLEVPTGRGLMLIRAYMTRLEFNDAGNRVKMTFERNTASE
ncbi:MAG: ATP-binding protein [Phycisphaeraceae bacterium]|nr:ATP-binding protein [Phycisphaeraceae bacterium]MBX3367795.1 ATP-binding protein [Phycisphaeraceae bacterium]QYK49676.1 MAG: ATP-binding protein [Phycisphaeraceae bacterium]